MSKKRDVLKQHLLSQGESSQVKKYKCVRVGYVCVGVCSLLSRKCVARAI